MGIIIGKALPRDEVLPFANFSKATLLRLTTAYNNISDGFGLSVHELCEVTAEVNDFMQMSKESVRFLTIALFQLFDSDNNGLVDGSEVLITISLISGMFRADVVEFILSLFDFSNSSSLSQDEVALALRSTATGISKVLIDGREHALLKDQIFEELVAIAFGGGSLRPKSHQIVSERMEIRTLANKLVQVPEISCFLERFVLSTSNRSGKGVISSRDPTKRLNVGSPPLQTNPKASDQTLQWKSQAALLTPVQYANSTLCSYSPGGEISGEWLYGLSPLEGGSACLDYTKHDDILYCVGKYFVMFNRKDNSQRVMSFHSHAVLQFSHHRELGVVASVDAGSDPQLLVWQCDTLEVVRALSLSSDSTVSIIRFSADGSRIMVADQTSHLSVTIWQWREDEIVYRGEVEASRLTCGEIISTNRFCLAHETSLTMWSRESRGFVSRPAVWIKNRPPEVIRCMSRSVRGDNLVCGTATGAIVFFHGFNAVRYFAAHAGAMTAIVHCGEGYLSAGEDARLRVWTAGLDPKVLFDVSKFSLQANLLSATLSADASMILFLTADNEVFEVSALDGSDLRGGPILQGHRFGEIHDLDTHPSKLEAVSVGTDMTLRVLDLQLRQQTKLANLGFECYSVAYSPLGDTIAVGCGGRASDCRFLILSEESLAVLHYARDASAVVSTIKFSVDGEVLAIGCVDGSIFLYSVPDDYELICKCSRHLKAIIGLDFSSEGEWLRSNSIDGELYFFSADDGSYQSNLSSMRDVQWASQDCIFSWHTKGAHDTVDRSSGITCTTRNVSESPHLLVAGCANGSLRVFSYPCVDQTAEFSHFPLFTSRIARVRFSFDNSFLITCGSSDKCVVQLKVTAGQRNLFEEEEQDKEEPRPNQESEPTSLSSLHRWRNGISSISAVNRMIGQATPPNVEEKLVIPFPSSSSKESIKDNYPAVSVSLERVFGYEGSFCSSNLFYLTYSHSILYTVGRFVLLWNKSTESQRVFQFHQTVITSLAVSPDSKTVASGDLRGTCVWDSTSLEVLFVPKILQNSKASTLSFSGNGRLLAAIVEDPFHSLVVFDWQRQVVLCKSFVGARPIAATAWGVGQKRDETVLLVCGRRYVKFWKQLNSSFAHCLEPELEDLHSSSNFVSCLFSGSRAICGNDEGFMLVFENLSLRQKIKAHTGSLTCFASHPKNQIVFTGGADGIVRLWNGSFECLKELRLDLLLKNFSAAVKAVTVSSEGGTIWVGATSGELVAIDMKREVASESKIASGHVTQLRGLCAHPSEGSFVTCGDDGILRLWNAVSKALHRTLRLELASQAVAFSPDGKSLAVGFGNGRRVKGKLHPKEGSIAIVTLESFRVILEKKDSSAAITALKFSPNGKYLVVGSADCCLFVYEVADSYSLKATIRVHEAPVSEIDIARDNSCIISSDEAGQVAFSGLPTGFTVKPSDDLLLRFDDFSIPLAWYVRSFWLAQSKGESLASCCRAKTSELIAGGGDSGTVFVAAFPASNVSTMIVTKGHTGPVSRLRFLPDNQSFVTIGGSDCAVILWKLLATGEGENRVPQLDSSVSTMARLEPTHSGNNSPEVGEDTSLPWKSMITATTFESDLANRHREVGSTVIKRVLGVSSNHGYSKSIDYNISGELVYFSGSWGIVFDRILNLQKVYGEHRAAISCLKLNDQKTIAASGDSLGNIHLWDCLLARHRCVFSGLLSGPVQDLSFSQSGNFLVVLSQERLQSVVLCYSHTATWEDGLYLSSVSLSSQCRSLWCLYWDEVLDPIIVGGEGGLCRLRYSGGSLLRTAHNYDADLQSTQYLSCGVVAKKLEVSSGLVSSSSLVCGSSKGFLFLINSEGTAKRLSAHDQLIASVLEIHCSDYCKLLTLSVDYRVKLWSAALVNYHSIDLFRLVADIFPPPSPAIAMACWKVQMSCAVQFDNGYVVEWTPELTSSAVVVEGHFTGELHCGDFSPLTDEFVTAGDDGCIRVWSWESGLCLRRKSLPFSCRCIAYSRDGQCLVGGTSHPHPAIKNAKIGVLFVLDATSLEILREEKKSKFAITSISVATNNLQLGVCVADGTVLVCSFETLQTLHVVNLHFARPALRMDFNRDTSLLRLEHYPDRLTYFDLRKNEEIRETASVSKEVWQSPSWKFSWETQGLFGLEFGDVTAVLKDPPYLYVGFRNGDLRLFRYPCIEHQEESRLIVTVNSYISSIFFNANRNKIVVVDALSCTILQIAKSRQKWTDISSCCRIASVALVNTLTKPLVSQETFRLHDSMSASELQDKKMDSLFQCNSLHYSRIHDLYRFSDDWISWDFVAALLLFLLKSEVAILNGLSIMETTHVLSVVWKDGLFCESINGGEQSPQRRLLRCFIPEMGQSLSHIMNSVISSDIYEDEEFCPGFKNYLVLSEEGDSQGHLDTLRSTVSSCTERSYQSLLSHFVEYRLLMLRWSKQLDTFIATLLGGLPTAAETEGEIQISSLQRYLLSRGLSELISTTSSLLRCVEDLKRGISDFLAAEGKSEEEILKSLDNTVKKDFLPSLVTNGPRRHCPDLKILESLHLLLTILSHTRDICGRIETWSTAPASDSEATSFEEFFREAEGVYRQNFHVIPRSLWFAFQSFRAVLLERYLWKSVVAWRGVDSPLPLAREWIRSNVTAAAWEMIRLLCTKRSQTFSRLHSAFVRWGQLTTESLYLDEKLLEDPLSLQSSPATEGGPARNLYWFATWTAMYSTLLMNVQMTLMVEMQVLEVGELDCFYWYWDYVFSTHLHAIEKLRSCSLKPEAELFSSCPDQILRACGQLCRGGFRLILACKYLHLIDDNRFEASLTSPAIIFENRFRNFREIINPTPLTYQEFAATMKRDLQQLAVQDSSVISRQSILQIVNASLFCYKTAKSLLEVAKAMFDQDRYQDFSLVALAKVTIAQQLQITKLKKELEAVPINKKVIRLSLNYQYHQHFGVIEFDI